MTNINCAENCVHEENGKCRMNQVSLSAKVMGYGSDCAYFSPRGDKNYAPPEKK
jgi:hypothetical protein